MQDQSGRSKVFRTGIIGSVLFALLTLQGCLTYSSYQSASIVERGHPHATVGITRMATAPFDANSLHENSFVHANRA